MEDLRGFQMSEAPELCVLLEMTANFYSVSVWFLVFISQEKCGWRQTSAPRRQLSGLSGLRLSENPKQSMGELQLPHFRQGKESRGTSDRAGM